MDHDNLIKKIKDLLAMADKKTNVNESAAAWELAQKLITKYKLSVAELDKDTLNILDTDHEPLYTSKRSSTWRNQIARILCNNNGCYSYCTYRGNATHRVIVGAKSDVEIVRYMFDSIVNQVDALCKIALKRRAGPKAGAKTFSNNFKMGAGVTIQDRLTAASEEVKKEYAGTTALAIVNDTSDKIQLFAKEKLGVKITNVKFNFDNLAYDQGKKAGHQVRLNPGLKAGSTKLLISN